MFPPAPELRFLTFSLFPVLDLRSLKQFRHFLEIIKIYHHSQCGSYLRRITLEHKILSPQGKRLESLVCRPNAPLESTFGLTSIIELTVNWWNVTLPTVN